MKGALYEPTQSNLLGEPHRRKFVVKLHESQVRHYDLRMVYGGVAISWMLFEHPSLDPSVEVESITRPDHNPNYLLSERRIPEGSIGAGPTLVADEGNYWLIDPFGAPLEGSLRVAKNAGLIYFHLEGYKLRGGFSLFCTGGDKWTLVKLDDEEATTAPRWNDISVKSGKTIDEI